MFDAIRRSFQLFMRPASGLVHGLVSVFITLIFAFLLLGLLSACGQHKSAYERGTAHSVQSVNTGAPLLVLIDCKRLYRQFTGIKHLTTHLFNQVHDRPRVLQRRLPEDTAHFYPTLMLIHQHVENFGSHYAMLNQRYQRYQTSYKNLSCQFKKPLSPAEQLRQLDSRHFPRS